MAVSSWLRNNIMPVSAKHHHVGIDGEPKDGTRPALMTGCANGDNEITKRQGLLLVIGFHEINISWKSGGSYGVLTPLENAVGFYPIANGRPRA